MKLKKGQKEVLDLLARSGICEDFYLAGETALSIWYAHRCSDDFDFFTQKKKDFFRLAYNSGITMVPEVMQDDTLIFSLEGVRCSFFHYPYKLLKPAEFCRSLRITIAEPEDIACMKAVAIMRRGTKKDFYDLDYLMRIHRWELYDVIRMSQKNMGASFPKQFS